MCTHARRDGGVAEGTGSGVPRVLDEKGVSSREIQMREQRELHRGDKEERERERKMERDGGGAGDREAHVAVSGCRCA